MWHIFGIIVPRGGAFAGALDVKRVSHTRSHRLAAFARRAAGRHVGGFCYFLVANVAALHREIERLQSALIGATARSAAEREAQQRAAHAAQVERVSKLLEQRLPVAERIEKAITDLVKGWQDLIKISDEALTVYPGGPPPSGLALSNSELITLVAGEMARLGNVPPITGRPVIGRQIPSLPAPRSPDFMLAGTPERITPLRVGIEQANQTARNHMEAKSNAA
jgi:hypothetical protein